MVSFQYFSDEIINISKRFNDIHLLRRLAAIFTIAIVGLTNLIDMFLCASCVEPIASNNTLATVATFTSPSETSSYFASTICKEFPSYFSNYAILILIATSIVVQLTHVCKFILMLIIAGKINNLLFYLISKMNEYFNSINHTMEYMHWFCIPVWSQYNHGQNNIKHFVVTNTYSQVYTVTWMYFNWVSILNINKAMENKRMSK